MHVAFVTPEFIKDGSIYPGGLATYLHTTAKALMERGVRVSVFTVSERSRDLEFDGIRVVEVDCRTPLALKPLVKLLSIMAPGAVSHAMSSWALNSHLRRTRRREDIDVLQYTNWKSVGLFRLKKGSLVRISSFDRLWDNNPEDQNSDKRLCRWLESAALRRFSTIIGPGEYLASIVFSELKPSKGITIVPTPIGTYIPPSNRSFVKQGKRLVMYAGTLSRIKGVELLLGTIDRYLEKHSDTVFLVVGKVGSANGRSVKNDIESITVKHPEHFIHIHHLEKQDLMAAYSEADLVLIPSLIDNFPNTALEAAYHGALLMVSDSASLGSLLTHGENAWILSSRSPDTWAAAIREALALDALKADRMKENMRQRLEAHKPEKAVAALFEVYQEIMETTYRKSGEPLKKRKQ
jgi:glycosyltransferase involved in cell wall biosynthesis